MNNRTFALPFIALTLMATCFWTTPLHAQSISTPGFYITPQGDTVRGTFPAYKQWNRNPAQVDFIPAAPAHLLVLTPANCRKFSIGNQDEYIAYTGPRLVNPIEDDKALKSEGYAGSEDQFAEVSTFLRLVSKAAGCELYLLTDHIRPNFFYSLRGQPLTELKHKIHSDNGRIIEHPAYKQQLLLLFPEEIAKRNLERTLESLRYTEDGMKAFFRKLSPAARSKQKTKNPAQGWLLTAGASLNTVKVKGDESIAQVRMKYNWSVAPLVSVGYLLPLNRNFGKYFFYPQVRVFRYKNSGETNHNTLIKHTTFQSDLVISAELHAGAHIINGKDFKLHLSGGGGILELVNNKAKEQTYTAATNSLYYSTETGLARMSHTFNLSTGVLLKNRLLVQATYNFPIPVGQYIFYSPSLTGVQLRVGYKL